MPNKANIYPGDTCRWDELEAGDIALDDEDIFIKIHIPTGYATDNNEDAWWIGNMSLYSNPPSKKVRFIKTIDADALQEKMLKAFEEMHKDYIPF